jgi:hypothetical protein
MAEVDLVIAEGSFQLREPHLHDGKLEGIVLQPEGAVKLMVSTVGGNRYEIQLHGVTRFFATDVREGNIILDITIARGEEVSLDLMREVAHRTSGGWPEMPYLEVLREQVVRDSLYVLELNPSYGCYLIGVAAHILITRE